MKPTDVRKLMRLMVAHRIDSLELSPDGAVKMTKSIHMAELPKDDPERDDDRPGADAEDDVDGDEAVLFYSSGAPKLSLQELDRRSANPVKPPGGADGSA